MKHIIILTTGGTIAMKEDGGDHSVRPADPHALRGQLNMLKAYAQVEMEAIFNYPSPHLTPSHIHQIREKAAECLSRPETDGVVITHGTDTLEETAHYLDITLDSAKPVVLTGAMRSHNELGSDGPLNLVNAVRVAAHSGSRGKGVLVVFNDEIHAARWVTKTHTSNVATFQSPSHGPIGLLSKKGVLFTHPLAPRPILPSAPPVEPVHLVKAAAGTDDTFIRAALAAGTKGLVVEALGQGNLPPAMLPGLRKALDQGVPVVLVSRCFNGFVEDTYGYEGGGRQLKELGVIFSNGLNGQKARIQLMAALHSSRDPAVLQTFFQQTEQET
ncbi:asparaginase [Desmospora profundinema]|uniref:asparaginase n=1 Tax=Desmospora profundinema TaxID=1571184 RepID=A0ABU1IK51_9BACL|nr:asparaginase [Desmospora profundinema]MDR6224529.1 L-asparaginase [Desmospora profundinema]